MLTGIPTKSETGKEGRNELSHKQYNYFVITIIKVFFNWAEKFNLNLKDTYQKMDVTKEEIFTCAASGK